MRAISSMATRHVLAALGAAAHADGLPELDLESVGGVDAARRVAGGEQFDLVFLARGALGRLAAAGHVDAATLTPIVLSQVAVAVPAQGVDAAVNPGGDAFTGAEGMRTALQGAAGIGYSTGPSGDALLAMIEEWGLGADLADRLVQARPGIPVAKLVADGEVPLGFQQLSELVGQPGIEILGVLPPDCAIDTIFAGAVASTAADPAAAGRVLEFFTSPAAAPIITAHSLAVPPAPGEEP